MARIFVVLALDAILVGAGIAMIAAYLSSRHEAAERAEPPPRPPASAEVEVGPARPVPASGPDAAVAAAGDAKVAAAAAARPAGTPPRRGPKAAEKGADHHESEPSGATAHPGSGGGSGGGSAKPDRSDAADPKAAGDSPEAAGPAPDAGEPADEEVSRFAARINAVVARHRSQLQRCYERASKTTSPEQPLEGRVDIRFRIMPNGTAEKARPVANTTGSEILAGCLVAVVESWEFPAGASAPLDFVWPFRFRARKP